jgi:dipeptidyl aminopeptidase/acylaminoacyl peptidase
MDSIGQGLLLGSSARFDPVRESATSFNRFAGLSEDGSKIFIIRPDGMTELDLATGLERTLVEAESLFAEASLDWDTRARWAPLVSPDLKYFAQLRGAEDDADRHLKVVSLGSGEIRRTEVALVSIDPYTLTWSPDSRYVLFAGALEEGDDGIHQYVFRYSVENGSLLKVMELTEDLDRVRFLSVSPDGRHVSMDTGASRQEIWRMTFNNGG